jgi:hypothetical protein
MVVGLASSEASRSCWFPKAAFLCEYSYKKRAVQRANAEPEGLLDFYDLIIIECPIVQPLSSHVSGHVLVTRKSGLNRCTLLQVNHPSGVAFPRHAD